MSKAETGTVIHYTPVVFCVFAVHYDDRGTAVKLLASVHDTYESAVRDRDAMCQVTNRAHVVEKWRVHG